MSVPYRGEDAATGMTGGVRGIGWRLAIAVLALCAMFALRQQLIMKPLQSELACGQCLLLPQLSTDLPHLLGILALFCAELMLSSRLLRFLLRLAIVLLAGIYLLDIYIYRNFYVRLDARDVAAYGAQVRLVWQQFCSSIPPAAYAPVCASLAAVALVCLWLPRRARGAARAVLLVPLAGMALSLAAASFDTHAYPGQWVVRNVVERNLRTGRGTPYAADDKVRLSRRLIEPLNQCIAGSSKRPNVVLVIAEGWSPYHSKLFSGLNDWTPRLDALAARGRYFRNLHAGGANTNAGLISILVGLGMRAPVGWALQDNPLAATRSFPTTLPKRLAGQGYRSSFMTNGNLAFSGKGEWLQAIGFDEADGHDAPEYAGVPRLSFDSAPDEYLYRKALGWIDRNPGTSPWLLVLENVSSHHPYTHPLSLERSERKAFGYMDQSMSAFLLGLADRGFLRDNLVVVISDHRAMTMISSDETDLFGIQASSRIPGFALSGLIEAGRVDTPLHQSDLLPSLLALVSEGACARRPIADMFRAGDAGPRCLLHAPSTDWGTVHAYCPSGDAVVQLAGSRSKVESGSTLSAAEQRQVLDDVAVHRLFPEFDEVVSLPPVHASQTPMTAGGHPAVFAREEVVAAFKASLPVANLDPRKLPAAGNCNIETLDTHPFAGETDGPRAGNDIDTAIAGWVIDADAQTNAPDAELVVFEAEGSGVWRVGPLTRTERPDVVAARAEERYLLAGFSALLPTSALSPGDYGIAVVYRHGPRWRACGAGSRFTLAKTRALGVAATTVPVPGGN